jgi:hypothetical protein
MNRIRPHIVRHQDKKVRPGRAQWQRADNSNHKIKNAKTTHADRNRSKTAVTRTASLLQ